MKNGGPAFPSVIPVEHSDVQGKDYLNYSEAGMSLRDYFAAQALTGWLSGPCSGDVLDDYDDGEPVFVQHQRLVARTCYAYADAMLAVREQGK